MQKCSRTTVFFFYLELQTALKAPPKIHRFVYDYNKADFSGLCSFLHAANLFSLISADHDTDINNDWRRWKDAVLVAVDDFIPKKSLKGRNPVPWINGSIINLINKKEHLRKKIERSGSSLLKDKFKVLRSEIKLRLRESHDAFFDSMELNLKSNSKRFRPVLKVKFKQKNVPDTVTMATKDTARVQTFTPTHVADLFNEYFTSVFTSDQAPESSETDQTQHHSDQLISDVTLTSSEVVDILQHLDQNKATGPDQLPARILKGTAEVIAPSLTDLFNKALRLGAIPEDWKLANVVPVYKKDQKDHVENYRPISLLPIVSKLLERCIFNNIKDHVLSLIAKCQRRVGLVSHSLLVYSIKLSHTLIMGDGLTSFT